ncbi:hypothetical protein ACMVI2_004252 [Salmonella enterica]
MDEYNSRVPVLYVMSRCGYFVTGMQHIFSGDALNIRFIHCISELVIKNDNTLFLLLVLDMSGPDALREFKTAIDFLTQINTPVRAGVLVSRYNEYLTWYISRKLRGRVTFFNSHNLRSGIFHKNILSWLAGKTFRPMHTVLRFRDCRYGFSLREWISLVIPLSGETMHEIARCTGLTAQALSHNVSAHHPVHLPVTHRSHYTDMTL